MKVLLIIPCFNEERRLPIGEIKNFLEKDIRDIHLEFVNDGSSDGTLPLLKKFASGAERVSILDLPKNVGKAEAIRSAMLNQQNSDFDYVGYFDADLAAPLEEVYTFIDKIEQSRPLLVMGSRVKLLGLTTIKRKWYRHYFGRVFATAASKTLQIAVYDTQCGAKLIKKTCIPVIFNQPFISKWLFDIEIIFRLKQSEMYRQYLRPIFEIPLSKWEEKGESKVSSSYILKVPFELFRIFMKYRN